MKKDIIGIFDLDSSTVSGTTRKYINKNQRDGNITYADYDLPMAFVLHGDGQGGYKIKLSRISSHSLSLRFEGKET